MEKIDICEDAEEISGGCLFEMTGSDRCFGLTNAEPGGILRVKTINSLRVLSKDPDIIVVKERHFKCEVKSCGQKFLSSSSLLRHKKRCHSDSGPETTLETSSTTKGISFACPVCSKIFSQQGNLKVHLRTHSTDLPFACNFSGCRRCFSSSESLKRHKLTHLGIKLFDCDICGRPCSSNLALKEHVARHVNLKPYKCDTCGQMFRQVSCYKRHLQTHNSQHRPFECDICHQSFSQTVYLKSHMKSHTGEKPFECGQCLKRFAHASDRNRHMSVHSDERKFACSLCGSRFTDPSSCRRHIHEHSSAKSNVCMVCDASFKRSFQLKHHMAKSHGIEPNTIPAISICQSLQTTSFSLNRPPAAFQDGTKKWHVIDLCPSGSVLIGGTKMAAGISGPVQREASQVTMGISKPGRREVPQMMMGISKPVRKEAPLVAMGISRPFVKKATVGISRHILETGNGVVSLLAYPIHSQASETNHRLEQEQKFPRDQKIICQLEDQIHPTNEPDLRSEIVEGAESSNAAKFSKRVCSSLDDSDALTHSVLSGSKELSFTNKIYLSKMTSNTNPQEKQVATESLPLHDTPSPISECKSDTMELLSLCPDYAVDQNPEISTALTPCKGFADMSLPYYDVLKMLSANDSLDQLNCFENLQDMCKPNPSLDLNSEPTKTFLTTPDF